MLKTPFAIMCVFFIQHTMAAPVLFEVNPLFMINQGVGINLEWGAFSNTASLGFDAELFFQTPYQFNTVTAKRTQLLISPKLRYYFHKDTLAGPFFGAKLAIGYTTLEICDPELCTQKHISFVAPIMQMGYRFLIERNWSVSAYFGGGMRSTSGILQEEDIPNAKSNDWKDARHMLNKHQGLIQPDYGITIGYLF